MSDPLLHLLTLTVAAVLAFAVKKRRLAYALLSIGCAWLYFCSTTLGVDLLARALDSTYLVRPYSELKSENVIIVFGGGGGLTEGVRPHSELDRRVTDNRIDVAYDVFLDHKGNRFLLSGRRDAPRMAAELLARGVPASLISIDEKSRTTRENALNVKAMLVQQHLGDAILVTSASHMPRALATLRAVGVRAEPVPVPDPAIEPASSPIEPSVPAYRESKRYLHEYAGLLYYRLRGWA